MCFIYLFTHGIQAEILQPFIDSLPSRKEMYKNFNELYNLAKQAMIQSTDHNRKRGNSSSANQTVLLVHTKRLKQTPPQNSPKATKAAKSERATKVTNVRLPPNYWKPAANHNLGLTWGDHPEGGNGKGMIMDGASDKKANAITWLTNTTGFTDYDSYIDMYIAQCCPNRFTLPALRIPVPASDPSVPKGFYGPDGDYDKSESFDLIFNRSTNEDKDMKPAAIDISGMVVDEVRNIGATFTVPDSPPATGLLSYSTRYASYLLNRKTNPLLSPSPIPPPPPPPTLSVQIVKLNLMPIIPGLPESGLIKDCMWPANSEDGRHIVHVPQDLNISIHKRSERQLRHVVFHYRRMIVVGIGLVGKLVKSWKTKSSMKLGFRGYVIVLVVLSLERICGRQFNYRVKSVFTTLVNGRMMHHTKCSRNVGTNAMENQTTKHFVALG
jgi:hypothetical protein